MPKFTQDMLEWWEAKGHEVKRERYYNPELVKWADVVWFDTCDNNLKSATDPPKEEGFEGYDMHDMDLTGKKIIVRVIDIEAWYGHQRNADWNLVTDVIFIAPHIKEIVERDVNFEECGVRVHMVSCGVNIDKFTLIDRPFGKEIAWVCERWPSKGIDYMLQILLMLPEGYTIHALGIWNDIYAWEMAYFWDMVGRAKAKFTIEENVPDVNEWLNDKDFILSTSKKEAFGYSIAEGMSKGLFPVVHRFFGAEAIWSGMCWDMIDQAVAVITQEPDQKYRQLSRNVIKNLGYTTEKMMTDIDNIVVQ